MAEKVWQISDALFGDLLDDVERFPDRKGGGMVAGQLLRSVGSISANIAEGFDRRTTKHFII